MLAEISVTYAALTLPGVGVNLRAQLCCVRKVYIAGCGERPRKALDLALEMDRQASIVLLPIIYRLILV